jgi:hypothetical protein
MDLKHGYFLFPGRRPGVGDYPQRNGPELPQFDPEDAVAFAPLNAAVTDSLLRVFSD